LGAAIVLPGAIADEQSANAQFLVDAGAAWKEPHALTAQRLAGRCGARPAARARWRKRRMRKASATPRNASRRCSSSLRDETRLSASTSSARRRRYERHRQRS
jgi:UDP-N-acetylglucosamine:LPS N-acetylglucosamine transferase